MIKGSVVGKFTGRERIERLRQNQTKAIRRLTMLLLRKVKLKLSDDVLNVRSGRLRRSINSRMTGEGTEKVTGSVGTNVPYARPNEFGETVTVKAHLRLVTKAWGKALKHPVWSNVRAHTVTYQERSFLRSSLAEMRPDIKAELQKAVRDAK